MSITAIDKEETNENKATKVREADKSGEEEGTKGYRRRTHAHSRTHPRTHARAPLHFSTIHFRWNTSPYIHLFAIE